MAKRIPIELSDEGHDKLRQLKLKRSYELGRVVSKGFVIEELVNREMALEYAAEHPNENMAIRKMQNQAINTTTRKMGEQLLFASRD